MTYDIRSKQYQADRAAFNSIHKASGNASFAALRHAELEVFARRGNVYAQHQLHNEGQADVAILSAQAKAEEQKAHAYGVAAEVTEKIADNVSGGAQVSLRSAYERFGSGDMRGAGSSLLGAGGQVAVSAVKAAVTDRCVGLVLGKGSALLQSAGRAPLRAAGELVEKFGERMVGWQNDYQDYLDPMVHGVLDVTG